MFYRYKQKGSSLIITMIMMAVVMGIGVVAVQISTQGEKSTRNDRNYQIAWQSAEAGMIDAEFDIRGPGVSTRKDTFKNTNVSNFVADCGASGNSKGLCLPAVSGEPAWLAIDFNAADSHSVEFGNFTSREFDSGNSGLKPIKKPRYLMEAIRDIAPLGDARYGSGAKYVYRVTSIGYGPSVDVEAVMQMLFRKEND